MDIKFPRQAQCLAKHILEKVDWGIPTDASDKTKVTSPASEPCYR